MKATPTTECTVWRNETLFNIDFVSYTLSHHSFNRHFHDHYVIELVTKGADQFYCNGHTYTAHEDQLVLINPGEVHTGSTISDTTLQYFSFYPDTNTLQQLAESIDVHLPSHFRFGETLTDDPLLARSFRKLYHSFASKEGLLYQQELFIHCLHGLLKKHDQGNKKPITGDPRMIMLIDFIRAHFKEELSLQQMAQLVRLNPYHLARLFKKTTGLSPYEYVLVLRTEYARQLLRKGYRVQEAALEAGFYDASHFNRTFYKTAGVSPRFFRLSKCQDRTIFNG